MSKKNTLYTIVFSCILLLVSYSFSNNINSVSENVKYNVINKSYFDSCPGDFDCDGVKDEDDLDDDNDGILDVDEGFKSDLSSYELTCNKDWWSTDMADTYGAGFSKIKYTFSNGSYAIIKVVNKDNQSNGFLKIPNNIADRKSYFTENVPKTTWSPSLTKTSGKVEWSNIHPILMTFDMKKPGVDYSIKFYNKDGSDKTVLDPVIHFDRIGSVAAVESSTEKQPRSVRINLKDNVWTKLSGTKDFGVSKNTVADITTELGPKIGKDFIDTTLENDMGAAAGSVVLKGTYTGFEISADSPPVKSGKDGVLIMILINTVEIQPTLDTDKDGIPDYHDLDSDNDGCGDALEGGSDIIKVSNLVKVSKGKIADLNVDFSSNLGVDVDASGVPKIVSPSQTVGNSKVVNTFNLALDKELKSPIVEEKGSAIYSAVASGGILDKPISYRWEFSSDNKKWNSLDDLDGADVKGDTSGVLETGQETQITLSNIQFLLNTKALRVLFTQKELACGTEIISSGVINIKKGDGQKNDPTFEDLFLCKDITHELPDTSPNGIVGTWDKTTVDTSVLGVFDYVFTPTDLKKFNVKKIQITIKDCSKKELNFTFSDICKGKDFELPSKSDEGIEGKWEPLTVDTSKVGEGNFTFTPKDKKYHVFKIVLEVANCHISFSIDDVCLDSDFKLPTISNEGALGSWDKKFDSSILGESTYIFTADDKKYSESKSVTVKVIDCDNSVVVHNVITLKQDNLNDFLKIRNIDNFPDNSIRIYNRWGKQVFYKEGFNSSIKWSGVSTSKYSLDNSQKLPTDTYFYVLVYKDDTGKVIVLKDWIYIKSFK